MTAEPEFNFEDAKHLHDVNILVRIDEQKQYRTGEIEIWGLTEPAKEQLLNSLPHPGELFDAARVQSAFEKNRTILPGDASFNDDIELHRNTREGTVSLVFDLRLCPGQAK
jgi:outer membrane protein assembly factor BamA